jgi:hypothetical protein
MLSHPQQNEFRLKTFSILITLYNGHIFCKFLSAWRKFMECGALSLEL